MYKIVFGLRKSELTYFRGFDVWEHFKAKRPILPTVAAGASGNENGKGLTSAPHRRQTLSVASCK